MFDDEEMQKTGTAHHQIIRESGCFTTHIAKKRNSYGLIE